MERDTLKILKQKYKEFLELEKKRIFPDNYELMEYYSNVQYLADKGDYESEKLYNLYIKCIQDCINESNKTISTLNITDQDYINIFCKQIDKIYYIIFLLNKLFMYLDRFYTRAKNKSSLNKVSFDLYINEFIIPLKDNLYGALSYYFKELENLDNDENVIKIKKIFKIINNIDNIKKPKIVKKDNEIFWENESDNDQYVEEKYNFFDYWLNNYLFKDINSIYENKIKEIENLPISEYIEAILNIKYQPHLLKKYFENYYIGKIMNLFNSNFIYKNIGKMSDYFYDMNRAELKNFYELNKKHKACLYLIYKSMIYSIEKKGLKILENKGIKIDEKDEKIFPQIEMRKEIEKLFSDCFDMKDPEYNNALFMISKVALNLKPYARKLANYINEYMTNKFKAKTEKEINDILNEIIKVFILLSNKIDFKILFEKQMSERLIRNAYLSLDTEKKLILMIRKETDSNYVYNMKEMISDLDKSRKENEQYNILKNKSLPNDLKFKSTIISYAPWNSIEKYIKTKMILPSFLSSFTNDFEDVYKQRHSYVKLYWLHILSKVVIKYLWFDNKYESTSTLLQYLILLQIEKNKQISLRQIAENIGCQVNVVLEEISGLIYNKSFNPNLERDKGLLLGNFDEKEGFKETDEVWFNFDFKNDHLRFNTMPVKIKKSEAEIKKEEEIDIINNKKYQDNIMQATITRIMKSKNGKKVQHTWLINEVSNQIEYFNAQPHQIKENIEKLIEKNVIKRDEKESNCYVYLA